MTTSGPVTKAGWRARLRAARRAVPAEVRAAEAAALAEHAGRLGAVVVCAHVPVRDEPGSPALLAALRDAGARVLLPVARAPGPLDWAELGTDPLVDAPRGLREPPGPRLGPGAVGWADVVLVPALAVDRGGVRLGQGGGFYDRTLPRADPGARLVAVVRDEEVVDVLPAEAHDVRLGWVLTPGGGLRRRDG